MSGNEILNDMLTRAVIILQMCNNPKLALVNINAYAKGVRALRGYSPPPPMRPKHEKCFSQISSYSFIRTIAQVYKSGIASIFTVAMVTKMATKIG